MEIERRSIEFVPESERYGSASRLFTIWFSANMQVTALIVGCLGVLAGLNIIWGIIAAVFGTAIGATFMAGHSAQGPHLGIPQMVQSRAQFGVIGAAVPLVIIVLSYISFTAANAIVMRSSIEAAIPITDTHAIILFSLVSLLIAFVGYELIHRMGMWMSAMSGLLFLAVFELAIRHGFPARSWSLNDGFNLKAFILGTTQAASWSIGFGPYVADYSRYLPKSVKTSRTFWYSYLGQALGSALVMSLGAILATCLPHVLVDPGVSVASLFPYGRWIAYLIIVLGVLELNVLNIYSAYMSATTIFTGIKGIHSISRLHKFIIMTAVTIVATTIAITTQYNFQDYFSDIIIAQIYFIVPWTAVNLADFYLVRRGRYSVPCIYDETGQYGRINWTTLGICALTVFAEIPLMQLSFYEGPIARYFGSDVTIFVSLFLPAGLYVLANRELAKREEILALGELTPAVGRS